MHMPGSGRYQTKPMNKTIKATLAAVGIITAVCVDPASAQQIISDRKIGQILGEVKCGTRDINNAVRYLNAMGVTNSKMANLSPQTQFAFDRATFWCN